MDKIILKTKQNLELPMVRVSAIFRFSRKILTESRQLQMPSRKRTSQRSHLRTTIRSLVSIMILSMRDSHMSRTWERMAQKTVHTP